MLTRWTAAASLLLLSSAGAFLIPSPRQAVSSQASALASLRNSAVRPLWSTTEEGSPAVTSEQEEDVTSLKGWQLVWEDVNTLEPEEHSQTPLILRSTTDTSYLKDRFFVLLRHKGGVRLLDASCGRCNLPLLNSPVIEEPSLEEGEDNTAIACKVCGMRHSVNTGKAVKPKSSRLEFGQSVGNFFFRRGEFKNIESHPTRVLPDGKIYAKISPRKEKRPTTDTILL